MAANYFKMATRRDDGPRVRANHSQDAYSMDRAETPLPPPPAPQWGGRALLRFATVHLLFLVACFAVGRPRFAYLATPAFTRLAQVKGSQLSSRRSQRWLSTLPGRG
jgi:hypothetical protein